MGRRQRVLDAFSAPCRIVGCVRNQMRDSYVFVLETVAEVLHVDVPVGSGRTDYPYDGHSSRFDWRHVVVYAFHVHYLLVIPANLLEELIVKGRRLASSMHPKKLPIFFSVKVEFANVLEMLINEWRKQISDVWTTNRKRQIHTPLFVLHW